MLGVHVVVLRDSVNNLLSRVVIHVRSHWGDRIIAHLRVVGVGAQKLWGVRRRRAAGGGGVRLIETIA
jgi:hypothetical protein